MGAEVPGGVTVVPLPAEVAEISVMAAETVPFVEVGTPAEVDVSALFPVVTGSALGIGAGSRVAGGGKALNKSSVKTGPGGTLVLTFRISKFVGMCDIIGLALAETVIVLVFASTLGVASDKSALDCGVHVVCICGTTELEL